MEVFQVSDEVKVPTRQKCRSPDASEEGKERNTSLVEISGAIDSKWTALKDLDAETISHENSFTDEEKFITGNPALPSVCEHKRDMFEKVVKYYFPVRAQSESSVDGRCYRVESKFKSEANSSNFKVS
eukprot:scaffold2141_cov223-Skeletonema_dohrnii-CCMP3373.AAC.6